MKTTRHATSRRFALLAAFAAFALSAPAAIAHEKDHSKPMPAADQPSKLRHYLMENVAGNAKAAKRKLKAGKAKGVSLHARAIALHGLQVPGLFPKGSEGGDAKPEIWVQWEDFLAEARQMTARADALALVADGGDAKLTGEALGVLFGSCKSCHEKFRVPDED